MPWQPLLDPAGAVPTMTRVTDPPRRARATLLALFVGYAGYYLCRNDRAIALPLLLADPSLGLSKTSLGNTAMAAMVVYALGKLLAGLLADRVGGRVPFVLGMAGAAATTALLPAAAGTPLFRGLWIANFGFLALGWMAAVKLVAERVPAAQHGKAMALLNQSWLLGDAGVRLGFGLLIRDGVGWRGVFWSAAASLGALALLCAVLLARSGADDTTRSGVPAAAAPPLPLRALVAPLLRQAMFWRLCALGALLTLVRETCSFWTATMLVEQTGMSPDTAAISSLWVPLAGGLAVLGAEPLARSPARRERLLLPCCLLLAALLFTISATDLRGSMASLLLLAATSAVLTVPYAWVGTVLPMALGGRARTGTATGLIDFSGYLGAAGAGALGRLADDRGWSTVFAAVGGVAVVAALVALPMRGRRLPDTPATA